MRGDEDRSAVTNDPDYATGVAAFERADWPGVIDYMGKVVARRPWRDDAYTFMGYAYRKLGNYGEALAHYHKALELNPHHRGALEYLGEAYLEMDCTQRATELLSRLETTCKRITSGTSQSDWKSACHEWRELKAAIDAADANNSGCDSIP
jgi:tetratricopeptide (TPR) repeat protein